ncbi:Uncharacterized protein GBIM_20552 [Gryllus bimaculatus]|nr:Uncharacterized protein GBIM_20552 [Gryllus bimaculatus]
MWALPQRSPSPALAPRFFYCLRRGRRVTALMRMSLKVRRRKFQSLVEALCLGLERGGASPSLSKLVLDLNLGTGQVVQLCRALQAAPHVAVLHLPHLGCGRDGLRAIAGLLRARPLVALNLAGGLSTLQHLGKQPSLLSNVSPKTGPGAYFSSLPRGVMGGYNSLGRPATLPRQPLQQLLADASYGSADSKRNSDSVLFQRLFHPLPACDPSAHAGSGFHDVFEAARDPACKLRSLNVSKCLLGAEDALCLGETGGTRLGEVLPVLLALADNSSLQLLDLSSQRLVLEDGPTQLVCQALAKNTGLRLLSLDGWTFRIEVRGALLFR